MLMKLKQRKIKITWDEKKTKTYTAKTPPSPQLSRTFLNLEAWK